MEIIHIYSMWFTRYDNKNSAAKQYANLIMIQKGLD